MMKQAHMPAASLCTTVLFDARKKGSVAPSATPPSIPWLRLVRPLHVAGSRLRRDVRVDLAIGFPTVAGVFLIELHILVVGLGPGRDIQRLLQLMVGLAHLDF